MATLHFTGKEEIWNYHEEVPTKELTHIPELDYQPQKGEGNMIIEGDNLYALKSLISDKDFVYSDNISKPPFTDWQPQIHSCAITRTHSRKKHCQKIRL